MASFGVGLLIQGLVVLRTKNIHYPIPTSLVGANTVSSVTHDLGVQVFAMFLVGNKGVGNSQLLAVGATLGVGVIVVVLMLNAQPQRRILAGVLVAYAVASFVAPVWNRGSFASRNCVIPVFLLASAITILVESPSPPRRQLFFRTAKVLLVAQIAVLTIVCFRVFNYRSEGPSWASSMANTSGKHCVMASPNKKVKVPMDRVQLLDGGTTVSRSSYTPRHTNRALAIPPDAFPRPAAGDSGPPAVAPNRPSESTAPATGERWMIRSTQTPQQKSAYQSKEVRETAGEGQPVNAVSTRH